MAILISKEKYERLINLFKTDEDKAMNEMLEIFKNYVDMYKNKNNDELENNVNFLDNTKLIFTLVYEFYCTEDAFKELEFEKQNTFRDEEEKEDMKKIELFLNDLTYIKKLISENKFTFDFLEKEKERIERIKEFIEKTNQDMNDLNQTMKDLNNTLERASESLKLLVDNNLPQAQLVLEN